MFEKGYGDRPSLVDTERGEDKQAVASSDKGISPSMARMLGMEAFSMAPGRLGTRSGQSLMLVLEVYAGSPNRGSAPVRFRKR
jgi:hypothetical protein